MVLADTRWQEKRYEGKGKQSNMVDCQWRYNCYTGKVGSQVQERQALTDAVSQVDQTRPDSLLTLDVARIIPDTARLGLDFSVLPKDKQIEL